jgi:hypothetical protein
VTLYLERLLQGKQEKIREPIEGEVLESDDEFDEVDITLGRRKVRGWANSGCT